MKQEYTSPVIECKGINEMPVLNGIDTPVDLSKEISFD